MKELTQEVLHGLAEAADVRDHYETCEDEPEDCERCDYSGRGIRIEPFPGGVVVEPSQLRLLVHAANEIQKPLSPREASLGTTFEFEDRKYEVTFICGEPNSGLVDVVEVTHSLGYQCRMPWQFVAAMVRMGKHSRG